MNLEIDIERRFPVEVIRAASCAARGRDKERRCAPNFASGPIYRARLSSPARCRAAQFTYKV